ncbi:MAG: class I SAM-dependent methyltransferase [Oscillospiraceae bacterium]
MYNNFASIYDKLQEVNYESFISFYEEIFKTTDLKPKLVLDLACGTGNITIPMARLGYDMIGVDLSVEMLNIAREKANNDNLDILFLNQDMTDFELYGTVDAIVCALDGVNYISNISDIKQMFMRVLNYLNPGGIMIFDINSCYKLKEVLGNNTFVYDEEDVYCVWNNFFDTENMVSCFDLNWFAKNEDNMYTRFDEYHEEYAYSIADLEEIIKDSGLVLEGVYDGLSFEEPKEKSERIFFVIQRPIS